LEELLKWVKEIEYILLSNYFISGWNSWYNFWCHYDEKRIHQTVDIIVSSGLAAAGYEYGSL